MKISVYIKELILKNECVIIPDFGGFESQYQSAYIKTDKSKLYPPTKRIFFKEEYKIDNGLLINDIIKKEKISEDEAKGKIKNFVEDAKNQLNNTGEFVLDGIGRLIKDISGRVTLYQSDDENFLIDSFGLEGLDLPQTKLFIPQKKDSKSTSKRKGRKLLFGIVFILIIGIAAIVLNKLEVVTFSNIKESFLSLIEKVKRQKFVSRNVDGKNKIIKDISKNLDKSTQKNIALKYVEDNGNELSKEDYYNQFSNFYIVAGSFKREINAQKFIGILKSRGYESKILRLDDNNFRVILYEYTDRKLALKELYRLRIEYSESLWILSH